MTTDTSTSKCPVTFGLDLFGDRWSLLIVRDIVFRGKFRYSDFLTSYEKISTNILANRLAKLEDGGVLARTTGERGYVLTPRGEDLIPVLLDIIVWSAKHDPNTDLTRPILAGADANLLDRAQSDRAGLIADLVDGVPKG